eukprot:TRINITY_DN1944_c1_g1_i8.p1 TRINITY_DN1944_c1_g1~~TRINITY_DN1944_c1_g1_i8.p1  ORF type:complete len:1112 (-),score=144.59 TRINITY_DN1944_c1_g1_i8:1416-4751(-)
MICYVMGNLRKQLATGILLFFFFLTWKCYGQEQYVYLGTSLTTETMQQQLLQSCMCLDQVPSEEFSCDQQVAWGKCMKAWMINEGYCYQSCGFCTCHEQCTCLDIPPDTRHTCTEQQSFGKCEEQWMVEGDFCSYSCGRCACLSQQTQSQHVRYPYGFEMSEGQAGGSVTEAGILGELESLEISIGNQGGAPLVQSVSNFYLLQPQQEMQKYQWQQLQQEESYQVEESAIIAPPEVSILPLSYEVPEVEEQTFVQKRSFGDQDSLDVLSCDSLSSEIGQIQGLETAAGFLRAADVDYDLRERPTCTMLLPSNEAFDQFLTFLDLSAAELIVASAALKAYIQYHIIPDYAYSPMDLSQLSYIPTMLTNSPPLQSRVIDTVNNTVSIISPASEAQIIESNISLSCNSYCVVHKIDHVLSPIPFKSSDSSGGYQYTDEVGVVRQGVEPVILASRQVGQEVRYVDSGGETCEAWEGSRLDLLRGSGQEMSGIIQLMISSTFVDFVENVEGDLTILAPTNAAFEQLAIALGLDGFTDLMLLDYKILRELMATHLLSTKVDLLAENWYTSTAGISIQIKQHFDAYQQTSALQVIAPGSVAQIVAPDIGKTCNTWIHLIDDVLIPYNKSIQGIQDSIQQYESSFEAASLPTLNPNLMPLFPAEDNNAFLVPMDSLVTESPPSTNTPNTTILDASAIDNWNTLTFYVPQNAPEADQYDEDYDCKDIMTILEEREELQYMAHAFHDSGLSKELFQVEESPSNEYTVFAVQNEYFQKMIADMSDTLANKLTHNYTMQQSLMGYMVVQGAWNSTKLSSTQYSSLNTLTMDVITQVPLQLNIEVMGDERAIIVSGQEQRAVIIESDIEACNGVIHVISHGLSPVRQVSQSLSPSQSDSEVYSQEHYFDIWSAPYQVSENTDVDTINQQKVCCRLVDLLEYMPMTTWFAVLLRETGLVTQINEIVSQQKLPVVVFVPTNSAFGILDKEVGLGLAILLQSTDVSKELILYHISSVNPADGTNDIVNNGYTSVQMTTQLQQRNITLQLQVEQKTDERGMTSQEVWQELEQFTEQNPELDIGSPKPFEASNLEVIDGRGQAAQLLVSNIKTCEVVVHIVDRVLLPAF